MRFPPVFLFSLCTLPMVVVDVKFPNSYPNRTNPSLSQAKDESTAGLITPRAQPGQPSPPYGSTYYSLVPRSPGGTTHIYINPPAKSSHCPPQANFHFYTTGGTTHGRSRSSSRNRCDSTTERPLSSQGRYRILAGGRAIFSDPSYRRPTADDPQPDFVYVQQPQRTSSQRTRGRSQGQPPVYSGPPAADYLQWQDRQPPLSGYSYVQPPRTAQCASSQRACWPPAGSPLREPQVSAHSGNPSSRPSHGWQSRPAVHVPDSADSVTTTASWKPYANDEAAKYYPYSGKGRG